MFQLGTGMQNKDIDVYVKGDFVLNARAGKTGVIKVKKNSPIGRMLINAYNSDDEIKLMG
jgi:predicted PilT family ATPase